MNTSGTIGALTSALLSAQKEMKNPSFDSTNPHFKSKFASLATVRETVLPVLLKHGLVLTQFPKATENTAGCVNLLLHTSGEWLQEECLLPLDRNNAQGAGSAITYARRYSLQSIAGVVADEDDDANAASATVAAPKRITPVAGSLESLPPEDQQIAKQIANQIVDLWGEGKEFAAYEAFYQSNLTNEMQLGIWDVLTPHSGIRNKLKKMHKEPKKEAA